MNGHPMTWNGAATRLALAFGSAILLEGVSGGPALAAGPVLMTAGLGFFNGVDFVWRWVIFGSGLAAWWVLFYYMVYPVLIRHYDFGYAKHLFWSMFTLYALTWITLMAFGMFTYGFATPWLYWVFVALGVMWLVWLAALLLRHTPASLE